MKLFDSLRAPNPRRVRWFLAEKQAEDIEIVSVDVFKGEHKTPDYVARAGLANVPALELDDGTTITESVAICRFLESVYPEPNMFGRDAREIAVIEMWTRRTELLLANPLMMAVRHTHPALAALDTQVPAIAEANIASAGRALRFFDRRLGEAAFIAGERVTMADIVGFTALDFARMIKFAVPEDCANVRRWADAMRARPAASAGV
ncbi:glutathione S-transferase family protein [Sphingomonas mucosissima]|uniref:Glutathionine S-transferase n=1 Tax=Sphingomonas mucosissima TaxID=370959 RepID=A0A245ZJH6_9SPHN|nr:glutathione S-transferase [Sphingomonas mucosissima]OWK29884.1 glutathionine S-transferase [Sphingomonas mucosissima]